MAHLRIGLANALLPAARVRSDCYYPQQPTCQIPNLWLILETFLGWRTDGFFVDVGAFDGVTYSNTWGPAVRGWDGLLVEPVPQAAAAARVAHAKHPGIHVIQQALGRSAGTADIAAAGAFSTSVPDMFDRWQALSWRRPDGHVRAQQSTLDALLDENAQGRPIDLLSLDVEGAESQVLAGFSWHVLPTLMIVELTDLHESAVYRRQACIDVRDEILRRGYEIAYKDAANTVFVRRDAWLAAWRIR